MDEITKNIIELKKEKKALILAHYYQSADVQAVADHVCDSFEMALRAQNTGAKLLVICGVRFMAESAKLLNPSKTVLLPVPEAGCPMADMVTADDITALRGRYPGAAIVCYVNSSAAVKAECDICCTSSSAEKIVRSLPEKQIVFVPDRNLGAYIASKVPEKEIILFDGYCNVHDCVTEKDVLAAARAHPGAPLLAHPECRGEVLRHAAYIGSTAGIINRALESDAKEFIIGTESSIAERLRMLAPDKKFYPAKDRFVCRDMKRTTLEAVYDALKFERFEITLDDTVRVAAGACLEKMMELG